MRGLTNRPSAAIVGIALLMAVGTAGRAKPVATAPSTRSAIDVSVDPRIELFSLLFRLAGNGEYTQCRVDRYDQDIEDRFGALRSHTAVKLARRLRHESSIGFDAPMCLAVHVGSPPELREIVPLDPSPGDLDGRWNTHNAREFLAEARRFAADARFMKFFDEHRPMYDAAAARMRQTLERQAIVPWFDRFFGTKAEIRFHVYLGMMNGGSCYGPKLITPRGEDDYCILGVWKVDAQGEPAFPASVIATVVHEFAHSYMNPLVDRHSRALSRPGEALFAPVSEKMRQMAYDNWLTMMRESMVRVTVVRYRVAQEGALAGMSEVGEQAVCGFTWVGRLSGVVAEYERHRDQYPTFESFMPRVIQFFDDYTRQAATTPSEEH